MNIILALGFIYAAKAMHEKILNTIMRWPMELFDTTPLGRVLNRFSKDVDTVDVTLPQNLQAVMMTTFSVKQINSISCVSFFSSGDKNVIKNSLSQFKFIVQFCCGSLIYYI